MPLILSYILLLMFSTLVRGNFVIDEILLRYSGVTDFSHYKVDPTCNESDLSLDFFLPESPYGSCPPPKLIELSKL